MDYLDDFICEVQCEEMYSNPLLDDLELEGDIGNYDEFFLPAPSFDDNNYEIINEN